MKIAGRLRLFYDKWTKVPQDKWVLDTVQGYRLDLLGTPVQTVLPREVHTSSLEQNLVQEEKQKMILKGAVAELSSSESNNTQGFYSNLFLVPKKGRGMRPVVNLTGLNEYIVPHHFKMEGIHT